MLEMSKVGGDTQGRTAIKTTDVSSAVKDTRQRSILETGRPPTLMLQRSVQIPFESTANYKVRKRGPTAKVKKRVKYSDMLKKATGKPSEPKATPPANAAATTTTLPPKETTISSIGYKPF